MTQREFYEAIVNGNVNTEVITHAKEAIAKLDATNEKRRNTPSKTQKENEPLVEKITNEILTSSLMTASDVASVLEISVQKASALLRTVVANGNAVVEEIKVPKKGTVKAYKKA